MVTSYVQQTTEIKDQAKAPNTKKAIGVFGGGWQKLG